MTSIIERLDRQIDKHIAHYRKPPTVIVLDEQEQRDLHLALIEADSSLNDEARHVSVSKRYRGIPILDAEALHAVTEAFALHADHDDMLIVLRGRDVMFGRNRP